MRGLILLGLCWALTGTGVAQERVPFKLAPPSTDSSEFDGVLRQPTASGPAAPDGTTRHPAVILFHSGGGWESPVTEQYARALNDAGFITLEPRLFRTGAQRLPGNWNYMPHVYGALAMMAARPDVDPARIGAAGYSQGGIISLAAATAIAANTYGGPQHLKFAAHAPFYPVCWSFHDILTGRLKLPNLPSGLLEAWTAAPVRIFAGDSDDYDGRDPQACESFVSQIPQPYREHFSVKVYPNATHGWDQRAAVFEERNACKGRGCTNHNVPNSEVTRQAMADLVAFFKENLRQK
jgi:dienelactone hydrolase